MPVHLAFFVVFILTIKEETSGKLKKYSNSAVLLTKFDFRTLCDRSCHPQKKSAC